MLQNIKLDDRTYEDIREEAISNIVKHCPEWTNHNESDPGITLIELFSSMTEMILYRLNRVPEKNYIAFLDLIGIGQRLPIPSKTNVTFELSDGYQIDMDEKSTILLQEGSIVTTEPQADEDTIIFETNRDLYLSNLKLLNIYSKRFNSHKNRDEVVNHSQKIVDNIEFQPFGENENSTSQAEIFISADEFMFLQNNVKTTLMFRLPTTMRKYNINSDYMKNMQWQYFDGFNWHDMEIAYDYQLAIDDKDADVLYVTLGGSNEEFTKSVIEKFDQEEKFYIKGIFTDIRDWLPNLMVYEISMVTSSSEKGVFPTKCFHKNEEIDLNNEFYPFGSRPKVDNPMEQEEFIIKCDEAFGVAGSIVSLELNHSLNPEYKFPQDSANLKIEWEYSTGIADWSFLEVKDTTENFTQNGIVSFEVPNDICEVELQGESGYWIRAKIASGDFGHDEQTIQDDDGNVTLSSTLNPPLLNKLVIHYTHVRKDFTDCYIFNNFKHNKIQFDKNRAVNLFTSEYSKEEAIIFGFDSYLSEDYLDIYFNIENKTYLNSNLYAKQRIIDWELYQNGVWHKLEVEDSTDGLTKSGYIRLNLPSIEKLEPLTVYIEELKRMWIKGRIKFNSLKSSPMVKNILLNTVETLQKETFRDEFIASSTGLPNMKYELNSKNLITPPTVFVGDEEYKAVDRFIDYTQNDKVFRFNGITGEIEFGDGQNGIVPDLGEDIVVKEYAITLGSQGNIPKNTLSVLREPINYIASVSNPFNSQGGQNGDSLEDLKKYAPQVLKTMDRAVTIEDYKLLTQSFSPFIKKAYCKGKDNNVYITILTEDIVQNNGFINKYFLEALQNYLKERSLITVTPIITAPNIVNITLYIKLKYTFKNYSYIRSELSENLLKNAKKYFDPFDGFNLKGYPLGRDINKGDIHNIINSTDSNFYMSEIKYELNSSGELLDRLKFNYNDLLNIKDVILEDVSYDI
jgi:hypothetical protein